MADTSTPTLDARNPAWWVVSGLLCLHLTAVFLPPFRFSTAYYGPGSQSPAPDAVEWFLRPYIQFCYLDHGYFFFAPRPGPSHLVRCQMRFADGKTETYTMPDRKQHWPRLLYHRHFMLAEWLNNAYVPPAPPAELAQDPARLRRFTRQRQIYERLKQSYAAHLKRQSGAAEVFAARVEHRLPSLGAVVDDKKPLTDRELFVELSDLTDPGAFQELPARMPGVGP